MSANDPKQTWITQFGLHCIQTIISLMRRDDAESD